MKERIKKDPEELYKELLEKGAVLNREAIDKVKKEGGKIGTVYLTGDYELACQIELTPDFIEKFCKIITIETGQDDFDDKYATIFTLNDNGFAFVKKESIKAEGKTTLQEFKQILAKWPWLTKTLDYRESHQYLFR